MSYKIIHLGGGQFQAVMNNGEIKEVGNNIKGMIRYTFFEDYSFPPVNWEITQKDLLEAYHPKVLADIASGKIKPSKEKPEDNSDWIEII